MERSSQPPAVYRVITIATVQISNHEDFRRSPNALQRIIESELGQMLLRVCGSSIEVEHVMVEPTFERGFKADQKVSKL